nr:HOPM interactor 7 [Tanacetum cinerariifolium]
MPSTQRSGSSTKVEESSLGDENGQKNDTSLDELHYLTGGTDIKMPSNQRSGSSTKVEESSLGDENGQKNDTSLDELHYLTGGTDIKVIHLELMLQK